MPQKMPELRHGDSSHLLRQPTRLLGRKRELEAIKHMLLRDEARLLTVTGPAGVGKTHLALEAGAQLAGSFPHGAIFIDLAPVRDPDVVLPTLARRIGLQEAAGDKLAEQISAYVRNLTVLLILDNFEQVLPAAGWLADILAMSPGVRMLVTSRVPLHLRWEQTLRIPPLAVPIPDCLPPLEQLAEIPSVALFLQRAGSRNSNFSLTRENARLIAKLVVHLDGLPLAIELAAARMDVLPLSVIAGRLEDRLGLLQWEAQDIPDRHRSLHAAINWSYELLTEDEQRAFRRLGVFVGRASLDAIDTVVGKQGEDRTLEVVASLAEKNLVLPGRQEDENEEPFFGLMETMREYACDQLEARGEHTATAQAHALYFLALAERADSELRSRNQRFWYLRMEREHDNFRAALRWFLDRCEPEPALRLAAALGHFWWMRGYQTEGWRWLEMTLHAAPDADPAVRTNALVRAGTILAYKGEHDRARVVLQEAYSLAQRNQDRAASAAALTYLGVRATFAGERAESARCLREARECWEALGERADNFHVGVLYIFLGTGPFLEGDYTQAAAYLSASVERFRTSGDEHAPGHVLFYLALTMRELGDLTRPIQLLQDGLRVSRTFQDRWQLSLGVEAALFLLHDRADPQQRARLMGAADALSESTGNAVSYWERIAGQSLEYLRHPLEREELGAAYREGHSLAFDEIVELTLAMLEDLSGALPIVETKEQRPRRQNPLSRREQEVLHLVASGYSDKQIAREMAIGERTVRHHLSAVLNKLGAVNRPQAVAIAAQRELLQEPSHNGHH